MEIEQLLIVEEALRVLIGQRLHNACTARREKKAAREIKRLDVVYKEAVECYRSLFNTDPIARGKDDVLDDRGFVMLDDYITTGRIDASSKPCPALDSDIL